MKRKKGIIVVGLFVAIVGLVAGGIYMTMTLNKQDQGTAPRTTQTVKAENKVYNKVVLLNNNSAPSTSPSISDTPPVAGSSATQTALTPTDSAAPLSVTPTEIILAYKNPPLTNEPDATLSATLSPSVSNATTQEPTKLTRLPTTGVYTNSLIIFAVSSTLIFLAFIF